MANTIPANLPPNTYGLRDQTETLHRMIDLIDDAPPFVLLHGVDPVIAGSDVVHVVAYGEEFRIDTLSLVSQIEIIAVLLIHLLQLSDTLASGILVNKDTYGLVLRRVRVYYSRADALVMLPTLADSAQSFDRLRVLSWA